MGLLRQRQKERWQPKVTDGSKQTNKENMKYKVLDTDKHLGDECPEYYETYEEACVAQERLPAHFLICLKKNA